MAAKKELTFTGSEIALLAFVLQVTDVNRTPRSYSLGDQSQGLSSFKKIKDVLPGDQLPEEAVIDFSTEEKAMLLRFLREINLPLSDCDVRTTLLDKLV